MRETHHTTRRFDDPIGAFHAPYWLITHRFPLDEINQAFQTVESKQGMKVIVRPHG